MKLRYRSPILRASSPSGESVAASSSTMSRTCCSARSASCTKGPQAALSLGISVSSSQRPLTWPKRSSCGRMSGFMPSRASSKMLTGPTLAGAAQRGRGGLPDGHHGPAERTAALEVGEGPAELLERVALADRRVDHTAGEHGRQVSPLLLHVVRPRHRVRTPADAADVDVVEQQPVDLHLGD